MNAASRAGTSAANEAANFARSTNRQPSWGGRIGGTGRSGGRSAKSAADRLALIGREGANVDQASDRIVGAGLADHRPAVGVADEDRGIVLKVEDVGRGFHVALERQRLVLYDADVEPFALEQVVDACPAGSVNKSAMDEDDIASFRQGCISVCRWLGWPRATMVRTCDA